MSDVVSPKRTNVRRLIGRRFGRLKVVAETDRRTTRGEIIWRCECKCGGEAFVTTSNLTSPRRNTQSCGCLQVERSKRRR